MLQSYFQDVQWSNAFKTRCYLLGFVGIFFYFLLITYLKHLEFVCLQFELSFSRCFCFSFSGIWFASFLFALCSCLQRRQTSIPLDGNKLDDTVLEHPWLLQWLGVLGLCDQAGASFTMPSCQHCPANLLPWIASLAAAGKGWDTLTRLSGGLTCIFFPNRNIPKTPKELFQTLGNILLKNKIKLWIFQTQKSRSAWNKIN